jgi:predicted DNA binding CopG/RHH family protein
MKKLDRYEQEILSAYDKGVLVSVSPTKAQLDALREAARATFTKNRRVNIRLSAADLLDIQTRAFEEGVPYQTLIASVLHKYVSGRLRETRSRLTTRSNGRPGKRPTADAQRSAERQ